MDKYEYKLKTDQMLELMNDGAYNRAAEIADSIDWKRVRNTTMLSTVSEIYEMNRDYQKSFEVLNIAYHRAEGSRKIVSRLCTLALKSRNVDEAIDYYDEFLELAPKDPNQYILKYQILRARRAPIEQQIRALEQFKKAEYTEEWAYELARLYQEAGMTAECLEECDDLILWFSEGQYVYKAMELKMRYRPLTPSQKAKYDTRFDRKSSNETEELPDLVEYKKREDEKAAQAAAEAKANEEQPEEAEEPLPERKKIGNTMKLDEALRSLLNIKLRGDEDDEEEDADAEAEEVSQETEDLSELESEIAQIESVADLNLAEKVAEDKRRGVYLSDIKVDPDLEELRPLPEYELEDELEEDEIIDETDAMVDAIGTALEQSILEYGVEEEYLIEQPMGDAEEYVEPETYEEAEEYVEPEAYEEAEEYVEPEAYEEVEEYVEPEIYEEVEEYMEPENYEDEELPEIEEYFEPEVIEEEMEVVEEQFEEESEAGVIEGEQPDRAEEVEDEVEALDFEEEEDVNEWIPEIDDVVSEKEGAMEDNKKGPTPILSPDIQRLIDEIEGNIPPEEESAPNTDYKEEVEELRENMGALADELRIDDSDETFEDFDDELDDDEYEGVIEEMEEDEEFFDEEESYEEEEFSYDYEDEDDFEEGSYEEYDDEYEDSFEDDYEDDFYDDAEEYEEYDEAEYEEEYDDDEEGFVWGAEDAVDASEADVFSSMYEEPYEEAYEESEEEAYDDMYEEDSYEDAYEEDLYEEEPEFEEVYEDAEDDDNFEEVYEEEEAFEDDFGFEEEYDEENFFEDDLQSVTRGFEEEFRVQEYADGIDDREIPDEDEEIDLLSATTPLSRMETAKLIATGKTAPLPLDEISDAMSMSNTGFVVHGRYDLKAQSGIGTRAGLTEEQKKLFSYFVPVRGMSEQLVDVLEQDKNCTNRGGTSATGNLLIIGNKGNGKTVLAVDVVKAIQKQRKIRQGKVAIVTGDSLNKKKISDIFAKLYGGALIIEKAGKMNEKTVARLNKAMEQDTGELYLVLEDQRKPLDRLLTSNREFRRKFTSRLEVPVFINDELVTFGQTYAQENGYKIDEMSILALYSRIDSLQREDHAVTVAEVKEIMDEAMAHSQKVSAKKLVKRVFGRNTDSEDRIILTEKDFNL